MDGEPNPEGTPPANGDPPIDAEEAKDTPDETPDAEPQETNENEDAPNGGSSAHGDQEETKGESPDDADMGGDPPGSDHEQSKEGSQAEGSKAEDPDQEQPQHNEDEMEEESKEEDPYAKAAKDDRCIWMVSKIVDNLTDFKFDQMWKPEHYSWILDFLNPQMDISKLFAWVQNDKEILFTNAGKPTVEGDINQFQMVYFIKRKFGEEITMKTIDGDVYVDVMNGDALDDLLNKMNTDYLNQFLADRSWPEGIRKDFIGGLHKFMAALTEAAYMSRGKTQLYIPKEDLHDIDKALEDRELIQRLESTLIFWTRQIKEVVSNQESQQNNENISSPLEEIDHWATRTYNLGDLNKQLKEDDLKRI